MLRCWFSLAFVRSLAAFALPLLGISRLPAESGPAAESVLPNFRGRGRAGGFDHQRLWASNEFGFAHAIEAYEELIDAHVAHARRPK